MKPEPPRIEIKEDWSADGQGRWYVVGPGIRMWKKLSKDARDGLAQRAKSANAEAMQGNLVNSQKVRNLHGPARGSYEVILQSPLSRGVGFKRGGPASDWYMTWFSEGQHPSTKEVTKAGVRALEIERQLFGGK